MLPDKLVDAGSSVRPWVGGDQLSYGVAMPGRGRVGLSEKRSDLGFTGLFFLLLFLVRLWKSKTQTTDSISGNLRSLERLDHRIGFQRLFSDSLSNLWNRYGGEQIMH